jgi:hypothetical protein
MIVFCSLNKLYLKYNLSNIINQIEVTDEQATSGLRTNDQIGAHRRTQAHYKPAGRKNWQTGAVALENISEEAGK